MTMKARREKVLLSFVGERDPFAAVRGQETAQRPGPILTLLGERRDFGRMLLFFTDTPAMNDRAAATRDAVGERYPGVRVQLRPLSIPDPTSYEEILAGLRGDCSHWLVHDGGQEYYVALASGTPQMQSCWLLLTASGELPANVLYTRNPAQVQKGQPIVVEIDPRKRFFPRILPSIGAEGPAKERPVLADVLQELGIIGDDPAMKRELDRAAKAAPYDKPVLILGETGVGKELIARLIHRLSKRRDQEFVAVNCGAIPTNLAESELFGHEKGAFTGAVYRRLGAFRRAHGGTLFLDEIGDLPNEIQVKVLRALNDGEIMPLGAREALKVNVRIVAATNRNLEERIKSGLFREDLYYRIHTTIINIPPLRVRKGEIARLAQFMLEKMNQESKETKTINPAVIPILQSYGWPGNIRELKVVIDRAWIQAGGETIDVEDLGLPDAPATVRAGELPEPEEGFRMPSYLDEVRQRLLEKALAKSGGNKTQAARLLGITPQALSKYYAKKVRRKDRSL